MRGKIIKGIAGFYYVHVSEPQGDEPQCSGPQYSGPQYSGPQSTGSRGADFQSDAVFQNGTVWKNGKLCGRIYECRAKGIFRNQKLRPLVGDDVEIDTDNQPDGEGTVVRILERKNELIRPAVANVDQAMVLFAAAQPDPNLNLLDRFLIMMQKQKVNTVVCFNKTDLSGGRELKLLKETYRRCGYEVIFTSMLQKEGTALLYDRIKGKTTVLAGPSGVGKSTFINLIRPDANQRTGDVSVKIKRGRHTTRHSELICVEKDTYVCDTPGFSSLYIDEIGKDELKNYFAEFREYEEECRFLGCNHLNEPGCAVKEALKENKISRQRYENYVMLYEELKNQKRY